MKVLIVGAGITGISLAHLLEEEGNDVLLIDSNRNVSSAVAAGIINPIVFRRMTLSWRAKEMMTFAQDFYTKIETKLKQQFYHPITIRRFFASEQEAGYWHKKQLLPDYSAFLTEQTTDDLHFPSTQNTFGTGCVKQAAFVDAKQFIEQNWNYFEEKGALLVEEFDYSEVNLSERTYKSHEYDLLVFCEGKDNLKNPWFGHLPVEQTKGEILTIQTAELSQSESYNRKCFMLPIGNEQFKVGSTYVWDTDNTEPSEEGRATIIEQLQSLISVPYTIVDQIAGVRPTVKDRRPLLGRHPNHPELVCANGMGTKGYMIAPLLMQELVNHLIRDTELDKEIQLTRYF